MRGDDCYYLDPFAGVVIKMSKMTIIREVESVVKIGENHFHNAVVIIIGEDSEHIGRIWANMCKEWNLNLIQKMDLILNSKSYEIAENISQEITIYALSSPCCIREEEEPGFDT